MSASHPELEVTDREQWRTWLAEHHAAAPGVWLVTYKRADAKRPATRARRIEQTVAQAALGRRADEPG